MTRFVVTGAAGFIGSRVAHRLLDQDCEVIGIDAFTDTYDPAEKRARATALTQRRGYRHLEQDLATMAAPGPIAGADVVIHLAGRPGVRPSFDLFDRYVHDNVIATRQLIEACRVAGSVRRLVYASSSSVYGNAPLPLREDREPAPISPYGQTKLEAEQLCLGVHGGAFETVALRYFTVYGPGQRPDMALRRFAAAALADQPLHVYGDGTQSRDFTYVEDIVTATLKAADAPVGGLAINVGGGERTSLLDVFDLLEKFVGRPLRRVHEAPMRGDVRHTGADLSRARDLLGFHAQTPFAEGFEREVAWLAGARLVAAGGAG